MAGPCFDNGQHKHSLGTSGLGQQQSGTLLHRIYYDRPGTGMLQHFQQSHTTCRHLAEHFQLANRIPLIPVFTALACLFLSAFLFEMASLHNAYFVPARVLAGLGGICFTLFSIVSILESGTSK